MGVTSNSPHEKRQIPKLEDTYLWRLRQVELWRVSPVSTLAEPCTRPVKERHIPS